MEVLTQRQRRLVVLLMTGSSWQTSESLAEQLGVSSKLVKREVAVIRRCAGSRCAIQSSTHRGYRLARLDEGLREELVRDFDVHEGHHSITHRYARLFVYLLFQEAPASIARLAASFFCSKTSMADELEIVRYRVARMRSLALTVDARRGVRLTGAERELRYEAAKWLQASFVGGIPFAREARAELQDLLRDVGPAVEGALDPLARAGRVSGEDVRRVDRFCAVSVWRSRAGHACDAPAPEGEEFGSDAGFEAWAERAARAVEEAAAYRLTPAERAGLAGLLADCVRPVTPPRAATEAARRFAATVAEELGPHAGALVAAHTGDIARHLTVMLRRLRAGHGSLNYQASATVARYPLESYVAMRFIAGEGAYPTAKAEAAALALVLVDALAPCRVPGRALLLTDEGLCIAGHLARELERCFSDIVAAVDVAPVAAARGHAPGPYRFTTDAALAAEDADALLVPLLPAPGELAALRPAVERAHASALDALRARAWSDRAADEGLVQELQRFLAGREAAGSYRGPWRDAPDMVVLTAYRTVILVARDGCDGRAPDPPRAQDEATACAWRLAAGVRYRGKRYERLIEVRWPRGASAWELFELVTRELAC